MTKLTEAEWHEIRVECAPPTDYSILRGLIEAAIDARLAPIRAVLDACDETKTATVMISAVRAALDAPVSASQDHDGAEGQGEGEKAGDLPWWIADGDPSNGAVPILGPFESRELALQVRRLFEAHEDALGITYWIGQAPRPARMRSPR